MSNPFVPIKTANLDWRDGLPVSIQYDDIYHSSESGIQQSRYVFIDGNDLINRWQALSFSEEITFTIAETGFGTGLNFLLSWFLWEQYAPKTSRLHFISCEKHPLSKDDLIKCLNFWPQLALQAQELTNNYPILTPGSHHLKFCDGRITLTLMLGDALECYEQLVLCGSSELEHQLRTSFVDAWYLDGFSPKKNKSMWSDALIEVIAMLSRKGTTLATYTAAAPVKTNLREHGFVLEKRKGFGVKRHMICATFNELRSHYNKKRRHTPWHVSQPITYANKSAIIIGAGLAGCFTAYSLVQRGWKVTLIDEGNEVGTGGSANQQAVLFPKLSAYNSPLTSFMLQAFLYAHQIYKSILNQTQLGELKGSLLLAYNEKEHKAQTSLIEWLNHYPELAMLVDSAKGAELTGIPVNQSGLFIPFSGWINSPDLCKFLVQTEGISLVTSTSIKQLFFDKRWYVNDLETELLILANGHKINAFKETAHLPVKPIRGQMTAILSTHESASLQIPLCAEGHVLPAFNNMHRLGATYELKTNDSQIKNADDLINLAKLAQLAPGISWSDTVIEHWAGVRATTPDYLPLVGQVPIDDEFGRLFANLETNSKRWIPSPGAYYPGLYACAGFGSRGLTTIPLCAEWLASLINNEMSCLSRNLQQSISPARFLRKNIIRGHSLY